MLTRSEFIYHAYLAARDPVKTKDQQVIEILMNYIESKSHCSFDECLERLYPVRPNRIDL